MACQLKVASQSLDLGSHSFFVRELGGEDFAYMLEEKPGAYIWIGSGPAPAQGMLHGARNDFNDEVLPVGATYWAKLVESELPR